MRAAASRTFCTAGKSRPMSTAMMAITTSSSIRVKLKRRDPREPAIATTFQKYRVRETSRTGGRRRNAGAIVPTGMACRIGKTTDLRPAGRAQVIQQGLAGGLAVARFERREDAQVLA